MARRGQGLRIELPEGGNPGWGRVGLFAGVGLGLGIAWPIAAGVRIGPELPGGKDAPAVEAPAPTAAPPEAPPALAATAAATAVPEADDAAPARGQTVVVSSGTINACYDAKKKRIEAEHCGTVRVDPLVAPHLKQLSSCPSALGLDGELEVAFDIDFDGKEIELQPGKRGTLPGSTVNGIFACIADYIRDVAPDRVEHKHPRYRVTYSLRFYPPGAAPATQGEDAPAPADEADAQRGLASVTWERVPVRSEPKTGDVVLVLVRGTRVTVLGRREDWYRIKYRSSQGWVYRGALGL
jgi:hypothetical protein